MDEAEDLPSAVEEAGASDAPEVVDTQDTTTEEQPSAPTLEELAGEMGWRPQDQWKGDPTKWKPAHDFVRSTVDVNHKLTNRLKGVEEQIGAMARTSAQLTERAVAEMRDKLLAQREEAFDLNDREAFQKAEQALRELPTPQPATSNETQAFIERNAAWWNKDQEATAFAFNRCDELSKMGLSQARQIATVEREMKTYFPELFAEETKSTPPKPAPLNPPGNRGSAPTPKGFNALPSDAKSAALDYEKRGICTRDEYAKLYFEEQA